MRIALIDYAAGGHHAPYARDIAQGLQGAGHEVYSVGPRSWCEALRDLTAPMAIESSAEDGSAYETRGARNAFLQRAFETCRRIRVDVAHVLYLDRLLESLLRASRPGDFAIIATLHFYPFLRMSAARPKEVLKGLATLAGAAFLSRRLAAFALITHSPLAAGEFRRWGSRHVSCIDYPNAVGTTRIDPAARQRLRSQLGVSPNERLLLCFGGTRYDKGVDIALEGFARAKTADKLLIYGEEQFFKRDQLVDMAARWGIQDRVLLRLEPVAHRDVLGVFSAVDVALFPYRKMFKGQSGPMVIAGALGIPVIAADVPVLAATVKAYALGRCFPAGAPRVLAEVLRSTMLDVAPTTQGAFAAASEPSRFARQYLAEYESAASRR